MDDGVSNVPTLPLRLQERSCMRRNRVRRDHTTLLVVLLVSLLLVVTMAIVLAVQSGVKDSVVRENQDTNQDVYSSMIIAPFGNQWRVTLNSLTWLGSTVVLDISITNMGDRRAIFPYDSVGGNKEANFFATDKFRMMYSTVMDYDFYVDSFAPSEVRRGEIAISTHKLSEDVYLLVSMSHSGEPYVELFYLGNPERYR